MHLPVQKVINVKDMFLHPEGWFPDVKYVHDGRRVFTGQHTVYMLQEAARTTNG